MASNETAREPEYETVDFGRPDVMESVLSDGRPYLSYVAVQAHYIGEGTTLLKWKEGDAMRSVISPTHEGDWLVVYPDDERLIVTAAELEKWYHATGRDGEFITFTGWVRALQNPRGVPIRSIVNGETITGDAHCMIVIKEGHKDLDQPASAPFFVPFAAFSASYMPYDQASKRFSRVEQWAKWVGRISHRLFRLTHRSTTVH